MDGAFSTYVGVLTYYVLQLLTYCKCCVTFGIDPFTFVSFPIIVHYEFRFWFISFVCVVRLFGSGYSLPYCFDIGLCLMVHVGFIFILVVIL